MARWSPWAVAAVLLASGLSWPSPAAAEEAAVEAEAPPASLEAFLERARAILDETGTPGAGLALVQDGAPLWSGGIGMADPAGEVPADELVRFRIGSISKVFTAMAILRLIETERLHLGVPLREIAPELPITNPWADTEPVRVVHLLEHTAGFDDMHFQHMYAGERDPRPDSLAEVVLDLAPELQVRWLPGQRYSYSNPGYAVAAYIVEKVSGMPYHRYVEQELFAPLGIRPVWSSVDAQDLISETVAVGHSDGEPVAFEDILLYPAGSLLMTADEVGRVAQLLIERGRFGHQVPLAAESVERMERGVTAYSRRAGLRIGYGLGNYSVFRDGRKLFGHDGGINGALASMSYLPDERVGCVVLINADSGRALRELNELCLDFLTGEASGPGPDESLDVAPDETVAGYYRVRNPRNQLMGALEWLVNVAQVEVEGEEVVLTHPVLPQTERFRAATPRMFRQVHERLPTAVFIPREGADVFIWDDTYFEEVSGVSATVPMLLMLVALVLSFVGVLALLYWGPLAAARKISDGLYGLRLIPVMASLTLWAMLLAAMSLTLDDIASINLKTGTIYFGSLFLPVLSAVGLFEAVRSFRVPAHPGARWTALSISAANLGIAMFLAAWGYVGLRLWNF